MPETTERILAQLNAQDRELEDLKTFGLYPSGNKVTEKPEILFARLDLKEVLAKVAELHPPKAEEPAKEEKEDVIDIEAKPEITFEDFGKLQFQVGKIIKCEEVKKSKETSLLTGTDRQPGAPDRIRNQSTLQCRRNGR